MFPFIVFQLGGNPLTTTGCMDIIEFVSKKTCMLNTLDLTVWRGGGGGENMHAKHIGFDGMMGRGGGEKTCMLNTLDLTVWWGGGGGQGVNIVTLISIALYWWSMLHCKRSHVEIIWLWNKFIWTQKEKKRTQRYHKQQNDRNDNKNININKHDTKLIIVVRLVIVIKCAAKISLVQVF